MSVSQLYPNSETLADIRQQNRFAVLRLLSDHGALSRSDLVKLTARTNTTVATILDGLVEEELAEIVAEDKSNEAVETSRGRPASLYRLTNTRWLAAGIQITSDAVTGAFMLLDGTIIANASAAAPEDLPADNVLQIAGDLIEGLIAQVAHLEMKILGFGISLEGFVNPDTGLSLWMLFRNRWNDVPVKTFFEERFGLPTVIDYRVYAAALAEVYYGAARGIRDFVYLNIDTGIATASVASGSLVRSSTLPAGVTGGLGHILSSRSSKTCFCGNIGCMHNEITTRSLITQLKELLLLGRGHNIGQFWDTHEPTFGNLIEAIREEDALALQLRDRYSENLGITVSGTVQLFSANLVIVGGPTIQFGGYYAVEAAQRAISRLTILHPLFSQTRVLASALEPDSATVGAATLVVNAIMNGQIPTGNFELELKRDVIRTEQNGGSGQ